MSIAFNAEWRKRSGAARAIHRGMWRTGSASPARSYDGASTASNVSRNFGRAIASPYGTTELSRTMQMTGSAICVTKSEKSLPIAFASLRLSGDRLEPALLTKALRTAPTLAYRKGEVYERHRGREARGRTGVWLLSSEDHVRSSDLNEHLEFLLSVFFPKTQEDRLRRIQSVIRDYGLEADVSCFWHGERGALPPVIREDIRDRLACIPAEIELDFDTD